MNILQMSFYASVLVMVVIAIRAAAIHKLPKKTFLALWLVVVLRLLIPFSVTSPFSMYSWISRHMEVAGIMSENPVAYILPMTTNMHTPSEDNMTTTSGQTAPESNVALPAMHTPAEDAMPAPNTETADLPWWTIVWMIGTTLCVLYFVVAYIWFYRRVQASQAIEDDFVTAWLAEHKTIRPIQVRQSNRIATPLTYRIFRPVILIPEGMDRTDTMQMRYIFTHEYWHIRHFDTLLKLILVIVLCIYWFNPFIWVMYILANRDLEIACDESVLQHLGKTIKASYALALVKLEEKKTVFSPYYSGFGKTATEERIQAIMKYKKPSASIMLLAILLVASTISIFAFSASADGKTNEDTTNKESVALSDTVAVYHESAPLHIKDANIQYEYFNDALCPLNTISIANVEIDKIYRYEITCLAYDENGDPLELHWDSPGEKRIYDSMNGVVLSDIKSYYYTYKAGQPVYYSKLDEVFAEMEEIKESMEQEEWENLEKVRVNAILNEWTQEYQTWLKLDDESSETVPGGFQRNVAHFLYDGWNPSSEEHTVEYILACVKSVTYGDGSVWENPQYENWFTKYQGKPVAVQALKNYYNN